MKKEELKLLIARNETPKVIDFLLQNLKGSNNEVFNELVLISLKNDSLREQERLDVLSQQDSNLMRNKINLSLLQFIDNVDFQVEYTNKFQTYQPPKFIDYVNNNNEIKEICKQVDNNFCVLVEGLSGSGKTFLVSNLVQNHLRKIYKSPSIWFTAYEGCTVDGLFLDFGSEIRFISSNNAGKFKELISYLEDIDSIIVIDDSDYILGIFELLHRFAPFHTGKARFILVSKKSRIGVFDMSNFYISKITGFSIHELKKYAVIRKVDLLSEKIILKLWESTSGLPFAISIFCTLVKDFGLNPNNLLSGAMLDNERIDSWFKKLMSFIGVELESLVKKLSLCDEPFNESIVKIFCNRLNIKNIEQSLENLNRLHLVQQYSPYRWFIHQLVSDKTKLNIEDSFRKEGYIELAQYSIKGFNYHKHILFDETELKWKIKSINYYQKGGDYIKSGLILENITRTAKSLGYYDTLIELLNYQLINYPKSNIWLRYHYIHSLLIRGKLNECKRQFLEINTNKVKDNDIFFSLVRLKSEIYSELGNYQVALRTIESCSERFEKETLTKSIRNHFLSALVGIYTESGDFSKAIDSLIIWERLINDNEYERAIYYCRYAIINLKQKNYEINEESLDKAISVFQKCNDKRGLAWSKSIKAINELQCGNIKIALQCVVDCITLKNHIGEVTRDYYNTLKLFEPHFMKNKSFELFNNEIIRMEQALNL